MSANVPWAPGAQQRRTQKAVKCSIILWASHLVSVCASSPVMRADIACIVSCIVPCAQSHLTCRAWLLAIIYFHSEQTPLCSIKRWVQLLPVVQYTVSHSGVLAAPTRQAGSCFGEQEAWQVQLPGCTQFVNSSACFAKRTCGCYALCSSTCLMLVVHMAPCQL
jgi:hypothetical protein